MKKFSATVISMILCLTLPACANSDTSSNAENGNNNSFESIVNKSVTSIGEESNGDDRVRTVCFYNDEKYTQPPYDDAYKQIHCDDYDKAIKDFLMSTTLIPTVMKNTDRIISLCRMLMRL